MKTPYVALVACCLSLACSKSSTPSGQPPTLQQFLTGYADGIGALIGCVDGDSLPVAEAYVSGGSEQLAQTLAELNLGVASGRLTYNASKAQSCLAELTAGTSSCWGPSAALPRLLITGPADCLAALQGTVATGGSCYLNSECANGTCSQGSSGTACPGTCVALTAAGAVCDEGSDSCQSGLTCSPAPSGSGFVCVTAAASGSTCSSDADCASGLVCHPSPDGMAMPLCGAPLAPAAACTADTMAHQLNPCTAGYWCSSAAGASSSTCVPQVAAGGSCSYAGYPSISSPECLGRQMCLGIGGSTQPGTCTTPQSVGGPCISFDDYDQTGCLGGLACDSSRHTCAALLEAGSPCANIGGNGACDYATAYCDANNTCQALKADGAACTTSTIDGTPSQCISGECDTSANPGNNQGTCKLEMSSCPEP